MRDQAQGLRELAARRRAPDLAAGGAGPRRVLAVTSGKGGVGKTSVVANLGTALSLRGQRVTVLDADFGLANLDILLNLSPTRNLSHLLRGEAEAREIVLQAAPGFRVLPGASGVGALADLDPEQRQALLAALAPLTDGEDFLLIDTAAGIGRNVVDLCRAAGEILLVTNPEPTSLTDAYGLIKVLWGGEPRCAVLLLVNSVANPQQGSAVHAKLDQVVQRFLGGHIGYAGHIVRDDYVARAAQRQQPFVTAYPRGPATRCVEALAEALADPGSRRGDGAAGFWQRLLAAGGDR